MIRLVLMVGLLVSQSIAAHVLNKVLVDDPKALCLDGTPAAYYIHEGDPHKFILNFEGGGWCGSAAGLSQTVQSCFQRSKSALGSSSSYPNTMSAGDGILSDNAQNTFKDWTMVHLKYCDGTGHQGYKTDPILYKGQKLYFRGAATTLAKLDSIDKKMKLFSQATHIMVTGESAGGLAAFLWSNYVADKAPKTAKVWSVPDSGIFLDSPNFSNQQHVYKMQFQNFMSISNQQISPPTRQCVEVNKNQQWKCMFAEYIHPFIKIPLFPTQSLYDSWSLPNIIGISCVSGGSLAGCSSSQMQYIDQYHLNTSTVLKAISKKNGNGCWAPACSYHVSNTGGTFQSASYRVPASSEWSAVHSLTTWMNGTQTNHEHLDSVSWPNNKPCSGVKLTSQE